MRESYDINYTYRKGLLENLKGLGDIIEFEKNSFIEIEFNKLDYLYLILDGKVKQSFLNDRGVERTILILSAGDLFGEVTMIQGDYDQVVTKTYTHVRLCKIRKEVIEEYLTMNPSIYNLILTMMTTKFRILMAQLYDNSYFDAGGRLYNLLKRLSIQHEAKVKDGRKIDLPITHEELANMIGSTRSTVTRILKNLEIEGKIIRDGRSIIVVER